MVIEKGSRIAVVGAGISGIAAANVLKKNRFVPVLFEKHEKIGVYGQPPIPMSICRISIPNTTSLILTGHSNRTCIPLASRSCVI